jgi:hypothetical protein
MKSLTFTTKGLLRAVVMIATVMVLIPACQDKDTGPLSFTTAGTVTSSDCPDGSAVIEITASEGDQPYTYYVIPEYQWMAGDMMHEMLLNNNFSVLYRYAHKENRISVPAGTTDNPKSYWVAVQDISEHGLLSGTNLLSWWKKVKVVCNN